MRWGCPQRAGDLEQHTPELSSARARMISVNVYVSPTSHQDICKKPGENQRIFVLDAGRYSLIRTLPSADGLEPFFVHADSLVSESPYYYHAAART